MNAVNPMYQKSKIDVENPLTMNVKAECMYFILY